VVTIECQFLKPADGQWILRGGQQCFAESCFLGT
jgi:hypothetical protein